MSEGRRDDRRQSQVYRESRRFENEAAALGSRVRALRQRRGWTLEQAAERMHLDLKHLQKVEAGQLNVTLVTLVRISEGLSEPMARLFAGSVTLRNAAKPRPATAKRPKRRPPR